MRISYRCAECKLKFPVVGLMVQHLHEEHGVPFDQIDLRTVSLEKKK